MRINKDVPCFECPDKKAECHPTCERYKAYSEERAKIRERNLEKCKTAYDYYDFRCKAIQRMVKSRKGK